MIPFFVFGLILLFFKLHMPVNSLLLIGVVIAASTPTTVSSNVVMTKNADGNEASGNTLTQVLYNDNLLNIFFVALMNAALGNVLGTSFLHFLTINIYLFYRYFRVTRPGLCISRAANRCFARR